MKNIKKILIFLSFLIIWFNQNVFAEWDFEFTNAPLLVEKTESSVKLEWEKIDWAIWYLVSYGKISWIETEIYENEWDEVIEWTSTEISWLDSSTKYYFSLTAIDEEANETPYSPELEVTTSMSEEEKNEVSNQLAVKDVEVIYSDKIKVIFTRDLDTSVEAVREFKIQDKDWVESEVFVKSNELTKSNELDLKLESYLSTSTEYNFTIISLADFEWNLVESWVNISSTFLTSSELFPEPEAEEIVDNNEWSSEEVISNNINIDSDIESVINSDLTLNKSNLVDEFWELITNSELSKNEINNYIEWEETIELNSAPEMETISTTSTWWEETIELSSTWIEENMPSTTAAWWEEDFTNENANSSDSVNTDRLPDTWAEHMIILAFALFIAFTLFRRKKSV